MLGKRRHWLFFCLLVPGVSCATAYPNRPLWKLPAESELRGDSEHRTGVYTSVEEDSSAASTKQVTSSVEFPKRSNISKVTAFSIGPAWYRAGQSQTIWLQPDFSTRYVANMLQHTLTTGEVFLGLQGDFASQGLGQLGLAVVTATSARLQGDIWEVADPNFDNFVYQYKVAHTHLAAKTKWLFNHWSATVFPYLSASLGIAWNNSYDFATQALIFEALPVAGFQAQRKTALTYTLGVGVQKVFTRHWQLGIGYEFNDWGSSALGPIPEQGLNSGLSLSHLYLQQLQCTISYSF